MPDTLVHGVDIHYVPIPEWRVLNWLRRWGPADVRSSVTAVLNYNHVEFDDLGALLMCGRIDGSYTGADVRDSLTLFEMLNRPKSSRVDWNRVHLRLEANGLRWVDGPLNQVLYALAARRSLRGTKVSDLFEAVAELEPAHLVLLHEVGLIRLDLCDGNEAPDLSIDSIRSHLHRARAKLAHQGRTLIAH